MKNISLLITSLLLCVNSYAQYFERQEIVNPLYFTDQDAQTNLLDFDNDGDKDLLVCGTNNDEMKVFINQSGNFDSVFVFQDYSDAPFSANMSSVLTEDFDNDNDDDIILQYGSSDRFNIYENMGGGVFKITENYDSLQTVSRPNGNTWMKMADVDQDGLQDLIFHARFAKVVTWSKNLGDMNFSNGLDTLFDFSVIPGVQSDTDIDFINLDGDNNIDAFLAGDWIAESVNGSYNFKRITIPNFSIFYKDVDFGDVNGDNYLDIIASKSGKSVEYFINDNNNSFDDVVIPFFDPDYKINQISSIDYNNDGFSDILFNNDGLLGGEEEFLGINDQTGGFNFYKVFEGPQLGGVNSSIEAELLASDFDNNGKIDFITNTRQEIALHLVEETTAVTSLINYKNTDDGSRIEYFDATGDGIKDLHVMNSYGAGGKLIQIKGLEAKEFDKHQMLFDNIENTEDIVLTNWYSEDKLDTIVATAFNGVMVIGDKTRPRDTIFTHSSLQDLSSPILAVVDIDKDGDNDLFVNTASNKVVWIKNEGDGNSIVKTIGNLTFQSYALGDLNDDGYPDLVGVSGLKEVFIFLYNTVLDNFTETQNEELEFGDLRQKFTLVDINDDGYNDLVYIDGSLGIKAIINNQDGTLAIDTPIQLVDRSESFLATKLFEGDLNNDGWIDFVSTSTKGIGVYLNNGDNTFTTSEIEHSSFQRQEFIIDDVDNDGYNDIITSEVNTHYTPLWYRTCFRTYADTLDVASCGAYTWRGVEFNDNGIYSDTIKDSFDCDSVLTLNLVVTTIDTSVTLSGAEIISNEIAADSYQWINCTTNENVVNQTSSIYAPTIANEFAVEITKNGCLDTSRCYVSILTGDQDDFTIDNNLVFPNPFSDKIYLTNDSNKTLPVVIYDINGRMISEHQLNNKLELSTSSFLDGIYIIKVGEKSLRLLKN